MGKSVRLLAVIASLGIISASDSSFEYNRSLSTEVQDAGAETREGIRIRDITFANLAGGRTAAYLVEPSAHSRHAAILYVHWYEPPDPSSNRTEYLNEAVEMARRGVVALLPATMWSDFEWFRKRRREDDLKNSLQQLKELRRAMDVLLAQPGIDRKRVAYVGHDFGAMFGAVMAGVDRRAAAYALQAGTTSFPHWYLFGPQMKEPARSEFVRSLSILDPVRHIGSASPAPVLLQFATHDIFVSQEQALEFFDAAQEPKQIAFYDAEHKMNQVSVQDRIEWLTKKLRLKKADQR